MEKYRVVLTNFFGRYFLTDEGGVSKEDAERIAEAYKNRGSVKIISVEYLLKPHAVQK